LMVEYYGLLETEIRRLNHGKIILSTPCERNIELI